MAQEHDAVERIEMGQAEDPADDAGDERRDAEPQESHCRGEHERRRLADRCREERDDDERPQEIDQREQMLLAVARSKLAEEVGADGVEQSDQRQRARRHARRHAADLQVRRQVGGDEHELEAAGEERRRHEQVAAVAHRFACGVAELLLLGDDRVRLRRLPDRQ